jgi:hypothetical protein
VASVSFSLEGPAASRSCGFDLPSADPLLAALQNYGGQTWTQALSAGSPAVGVIPTASCPTADLGVDQRGYPRPGRGKSHCDVGAFETQASGPGLRPPGALAPACPPATGTQVGASLGPLQLGMTGAQARRADSHVSHNRRAHQDFFCLTPRGIRVGYPSPKLLATLLRAERGRYIGRVIWITSANTRYAVDGIRPGTSIKTATAHLKLSSAFAVGGNAWYLTPLHDATGVIKVSAGIVSEVGIAVKALTPGRTAQRVLLTSFS